MTDLHNISDLEALYGPLTKFSEHKRGQVIRYRDESKVEQGEILWVCERAQLVEGRPEIPLHYVVATSSCSFPATVFPSDVIGTVEPQADTDTAQLAQGHVARLDDGRLTLHWTEEGLERIRIFTLEETLNLMEFLYGRRDEIVKKSHEE